MTVRPYYLAVKGEPGRDIQLQKSATHIQWRYSGDVAWTNLVALVDLKGDPGLNGRSVELQVSGGFIQWRLVGDTSWANLIALSAITGAPGAGFNPGTPVPRTISIGTVYQASDTSKPAMVYANVEQSLTAAVSLVGAVLELRIGPLSAGLAAGSSGYPVMRTRTTLTGLLAVVGLLLGTGERSSSGRMVLLRALCQWKRGDDSERLRPANSLNDAAHAASLSFLHAPAASNIRAA